MQNDLPDGCPTCGALPCDWAAGACEAIEALTLPTPTREEVAEAHRMRDEALSDLGTCGDGNCIIAKPRSTHTNGGCKCSRDWYKMQKFAWINNAFADAILQLIRKDG